MMPAARLKTDRGGTAMLEVGQSASSLSDPPCNAVEFIRWLRETGEPIVLAVNGKAQLAVQDATSFEMLLELVDRLETLDGTRSGLADMAEGRTTSIEVVREKFLPRPARRTRT
jgi:hypothetical protein